MHFLNNNRLRHSINRIYSNDYQKGPYESNKIHGLVLMIWKNVYDGFALVLVTRVSFKKAVIYLKKFSYQVF